MSKEQILADYKLNEKLYNSFGERMVNLLSDLIKKDGIIAHQISTRIKDIYSLSKKIDKKGNKYSAIGDITDVIGVRVITYLESEVDEIAEILKKEFLIDELNSIDKRILQVNQFGYRSLHMVIGLNPKRCSLPEYSQYTSIKCEVQIRSVLQHAWAEIEHDLGYKGENAPDEFKRAFNRLAALLETADVEFVNLKYSLSKYEKDVSQKILTEPEIVDINKASIASFVLTNKIITRALRIIKTLTGHEPVVRSLEIVIPLLEYFELKNIKDLEEVLIANEQQYLNFVKNFVVSRSIKEELSNEVTLFYLAHYLAVKDEDISAVQDYFINNLGSNINGNFQSYIDCLK